MHSATRILVAMSAVYLVQGCSRKRPLIREYAETTHSLDLFSQEPKSSSPTSMPASPPLDHAEAHLAWDRPESWSELEAGGMRLAAFKVTHGDQTAECTIIRLPGEAGGTLANVKRWLGQLDITDWSDDAIAHFLEHQTPFTSTGGYPGMLIDFRTAYETFTGDKTTMLAAILHTGSQTLYIKLMGPGPLIAAEQNRFFALCTSIRHPPH